VRIDATSASPKGDADERAVLQRTIEADRCYILDRGSISKRLWNAINAAGSSYVCRSSDRTLATVTHVNDLTDADRAANVISDELVDLGWKARHRMRPDHPVRLVCVAVKPHESSRGTLGPHCDGVLRLVTNRLDLPAELIAEIYRLRWIIEMFFRTFKQLLGCRHLFSCDHNGVEIQASFAMIVCMLILPLYGREAEPGDGSDGLVLPHRPRQPQRTRGLHQNTKVARAGAATALSARGFRCCAVEARTQRGAAHALERAMGASAARMAKRSGHAVSRGLEGRDERPARGRG